MSICPPQYAKDVLYRLECEGYQAYFVGGCVRDMLMQRRPQDWDICTDARPETVLRIFPRAEPTGLKHGTVTVRSGGHHIEVTTFRTDGVYLDHRRPEQVSFVPDLQQDLERRDFTMNAMALSLSGELQDPFGGREDIAAACIRCVGAPGRRFEEDALRMLRALRFSARLGFVVEEKTMQAIRQCAPLCAELASERVREELEKILLSKRPEMLEEVLCCGLLDRYTRHGEEIPRLYRLRTLPKTRQARWAGSCAVLENAGVIADTEQFLRALRLDGSTIRSCASGVKAALYAPPEDRNAWKRLLADSGADAAACAAAALDALRPAGIVKALRALQESGECCSMQQLAVRGRDLTALGLQGEAVGAVLRRLLEHVIEHPEDNQKEILLKLI